MDTFTIIKVVKAYQKADIFKGVYPCDSLPSRFSLPAIFIVNLSPHNEPGSHWIAIYISSIRYAFYFDSFGFPVNNYHISRFLKKHSIRVSFNKTQLQHVTSNKCGKFCCGFAITILKGGNISSFMNKFSKNLFVNDIVIENMYNYIKKKAK